MVVVQAISDKKRIKHVKHVADCTRSTPEGSQDFDPDFRGQLTPDGRPIYGSKLEDTMPDCGELSVDGWDD